MVNVVSLGYARIWFWGDELCTRMKVNNDSHKGDASSNNGKKRKGSKLTCAMRSVLAAYACSAVRSLSIRSW